MARKLVYVGHYLGSLLFPGGSAYAFSFADAVAGYAALKGTQYELSVFYQVEAYPEKSKGLF